MGGQSVREARCVPDLASLSKLARAARDSEACRRLRPLPAQMLNAAMSCGAGVEVCGVLALMTGLGSGMQNVTGGAVYGHPTPVVHGLWPQTPPFGDSACVAPSAGASNATRVYPCYQCARPSPGVVDTNCSGVPHHSPSEFQDHEWSKHGVCAGVRDAQDYLTQICTLAAPPLRVLSAARSAGTTSLDRFKALLEVNLALALTRTRTLPLTLPLPLPLTLPLPLPLPKP